MSLKEVSDASFEQDVLNSDMPVLVDFWAPWCGPCRAVGPVLEELAGEFEGKITIVKVNVDECPDTAAKYGIMSIPAMHIFKKGKSVGTQVGALPKLKLKAFIESNSI